MSTPSPVLDQIATRIKAVGLLLAVVPGTAVFFTGVLAPPGLNMRFGVIMTIISTLTVMLFLLYQKRLARTSRKRVVHSVLWLALTGLIAALGFAYLHQLCIHERVVYMPRDNQQQTIEDLTIRDTVYIPMILGGSLKEWAKEHGRGTMIDRTPPEVVREKVKETPFLMSLTSAVFLLLYLTMNLAVVSAFMITGFRVTAPSVPE
jgi:hypothetical protein